MTKEDAEFFRSWAVKIIKNNNKLGGSPTDQLYRHLFLTQFIRDIETHSGIERLQLRSVQEIRNFVNTQGLNVDMEIK